MSFGHPWWLVVLVPVLAAAAYEVVRRRSVRPVIVRTLVLALLALAASEPRLERDVPSSTVVFLIDRSASVGDAALARAWQQAGELRAKLDTERAGAVAFDTTAEVAIAPGDAWVAPAAQRGAGVARDGTDMAGAIRLGLALIPPGAGGHLVLIGDGRATAGDLTAATAAATARGIPVSTIATPGTSGDPAIAAIVLDNDRVRAGATVTGHVDVDADGVTATGKVVVRVGGTDVVAKSVELTGKHVQVPFTYALPPGQSPGVISVEAALDPPAAPAQDRDRGNDRSATRLVVERPPNVLILDGDENGAATLAEALRAEQMQVRVTSAIDGPTPDLNDTDLLILANAPVKPGIGTGVLDDEVGEKITHWVNNGGGLIVLGGPQALDGAYAANRIADALPVEIEPRTPILDSSATVIVILDASGSMGLTVGGRTKLALAAEGGAAAIRLLRSFDKIGLMSVEDTVRWVIPVRAVGDDTSALEARAREVEVGGDGIFVYTGLKAAQKALDKATTPIKHVILFSDTTDAAEQVKGIDYGYFRGWPSGRPNSLSLAKEMHEKGITVSVIGVGEGADNGFDAGSYYDDEDDTDFLRELAIEGGGRYYRTTDAKQLRGLFVQDAKRLLDSHAREEDITLESVVQHPALAGVDVAHAPPLHGYQQLKPRPAAQVVIRERGGNDPILTRWPYGLGEVAVWSSDAGPRWARDWTSWPGYTRMWAQLARTALRRREGDTTAIETELAGDTATVRIVRRDDKASITPHAKIVEKDRRDLPLRVVSPGVYEATVDVAGGREPTIELVGPDGRVAAQRTIVRPPSRELRERGPDPQALTQLARATGGTVAPATITAAGRPTPTTTPLAAWLLLAAIALLPLDALLRRAARGD